MKLKNNQSGAAHIVAILLVILIVAVGFVGWKVWDNQNQDIQPINNASATNSNNTDSMGDSTTTAIEIKALGIKVNDPENRKLQLHAEKICAAECATKDSYFIRDNNSDYFSRCNYAAGISEIDLKTREDRTDIANLSKKIGDTYYWVNLGSNFQSPCGDATDDAFVTSIRQYILDNMEALIK